MSLQRLKTMALNVALFSKIGYILTVVSVLLQSITLLWLTVMPNKLIHFFEKVRIYEPFVTDIDNTKLSFFELSTGIIAFLFLFIILRKTETLFSDFGDKPDFLNCGMQVKNLSALFFIQSISLPIIKTVAYLVFLKEKAPFGILNISSLVLALLLWFAGQCLQTKFVEE